MTWDSDKALYLAGAGLGGALVLTGMVAFLVWRLWLPKHLRPRRSS